QRSSFALPNEVKRAYELLKQQRSFGFLIIPSSNFLSKVKVPDEDIKKYYEQYISDFTAPEKVSIEYIQLSPQALSQTVTVTSDEIKQYYQTNIQNFTTPKGTKTLEQISADIKKTIIQQKTDQLFSKKSEQLSNMAFTNPTSLAEISKQLDLKINK